MDTRPSSVAFNHNRPRAGSVLPIIAQINALSQVSAAYAQEMALLDVIFQAAESKHHIAMSSADASSCPTFVTDIYITPSDELIIPDHDSLRRVLMNASLRERFFLAKFH